MDACVPSVRRASVRRKGSPGRRRLIAAHPSSSLEVGAADRGSLNPDAALATRATGLPADFKGARLRPNANGANTHKLNMAVPESVTRISFHRRRSRPPPQAKKMAFGRLARERSKKSCWDISKRCVWESADILLTRSDSDLELLRRALLVWPGQADFTGRRPSSMGDRQSTCSGSRSRHAEMKDGEGIGRHERISRNRPLP